MAIKHTTTKAPGQKLYASEWNAEHTGTATPEQHGNEKHTSTFITGAEVPANETDPSVDASLKGITLTQVRDHAPKEHGNEAHNPNFISVESDPVFTAWDKDHDDLTNVTPDQHHPRASVADTATIDMTLTGQEIKGDVRKQMSIDADENGLKLKGDSENPGNLKLYGTNGTGVKGWYNQPTGGTPGGGTGAVQFNNNGAFGGDETNLFWDNVDKKLGIGTGTATETLDVDGSAIFNKSQGIKDFRIDGWLTSNVLFVKGSTKRVGIKTNNPTKELDVNGSAGISTDLNVGRWISGQRLKVTAGGDWTGQNNPLSITGTGAVQQFVIDDNEDIYIETGQDATNSFIRFTPTDRNGGYLIQRPLSIVWPLNNTLNPKIGVGINAPISKLQVSGGDLGLGDSTATGNQPIVIWLTNNSGATRTAGEIVIIGGADNSFTVTTTANSTAVLGVVYDSSIASGAVGRIAVGGVVSVLSAGATTRGQHVVTSTTSGKAGSTASPTAGASIGVWLQSLGSAGTGKVLLR
jgi:hypothetical protein